MIRFGRSCPGFLSVWFGLGALLSSLLIIPSVYILVSFTSSLAQLTGLGKYWSLFVKYFYFSLKHSNRWINIIDKTVNDDQGWASIKKNDEEIVFLPHELFYAKLNLYLVFIHFPVVIFRFFLTKDADCSSFAKKFILHTLLQS